MVPRKPSYFIDDKLHKRLTRQKLFWSYVNINNKQVIIGKIVCFKINLLSYLKRKCYCKVKKGMLLFLY